MKWALEQLSGFVNSTMTPTDQITSRMMVVPGPSYRLEMQAYVVEKILDRVLPYWRTLPVPAGHYGYGRHHVAAARAIAQLQREEELREKLGESAPQLDAQTLHPWVWDPAKLLWRNGHYREAVGAAARQLNAETQTKLGRRDSSEWQLLVDAFKLDPPVPGRPRLRLMENDSSTTFKSIHEGAAAFARGCFMAVRNPASHDVLGELPEHEALEQLASFSLLARWVAEATVEQAEDNE